MYRAAHQDSERELNTVSQGVDPEIAALQLPRDPHAAVLAAFDEAFHPNAIEWESLQKLMNFVNNPDVSRSMKDEDKNKLRAALNLSIASLSDEELTNLYQALSKILLKANIDKLSPKDKEALMLTQNFP